MLDPQMMQALMAGFSGGGQGQGGSSFQQLISAMFPSLGANGGFQTLPHPLGAPGGMSLGGPPQVTPPVAPSPLPVRQLNVFGRPIVGGATGDRSGLSRQTGNDHSGPQGVGGGVGGDRSRGPHRL